LCCGGTSSIPAGSGAAGLSRGAIVLLLAHLLAVALTAVWLRRLERRVWCAARAAAASAGAFAAAVLRLLVSFVGSLAPLMRPSSEPPVVLLRVPASVLLTRAVSRRGPPVAVGL
jgi:hypothetical protein